MAGGKFWSSPDLEPKRDFLFRMNIGDVAFFLVKSVQRPNYELGSHEHHYLNHVLKFPTKVTWQDIDVTIVEPIDDNSLDRIKEIIVNSGYTWIEPDSNLTSADLQTISKKRAIEALRIGSGKGMMLEHIDHDGNVVDRWTLRNAWISNFNPNELAYENEGLAETTLTVTYDFAKLEAFNITDQLRSVLP